MNVYVVLHFKPNSYNLAVLKILVAKDIESGKRLAREEFSSIKQLMIIDVDDIQSILDL